MNRKKWLIVGGAATLVILLIVASILSNRESGTKVEYETVSRRNLVSVVSASGALDPQQQVQISASTPGEVVRVGVVEGQLVRRGQFLLQLDPVPASAAASAQSAAVGAARAELESAEAQLELAGRQHERVRTLAERDLVPRAELESAETELRARQAAVAAARGRVSQASASLTSARHEVGRVTIRSPIDGVVQRINVEEGEIAMIGTMNQAGTVLLTIADLGVMEAMVDVDETDVVHIRVGQPAKVSVDAFPDTTLTGQVTEVSTLPKIVPTTTGPAQGSADFEVTITLDGDFPAAVSGLTASADITTAERENALVIPVQSLVVRAVQDDAAEGGVVEREGVFVEEDGTARFVPVKVGIASERYFEVLEGLDEGARVISGPYQALRDLADGEPVRATEADQGDPLARSENE
ncbi:MAG TPA: efflux RND transporter periplasmic adaptor subunit [Gemmatimonadota bacterium]|nr:efflux RND transporter periplasmic adaptor subunit [Gemmatimonadota bacterium]